MNYTSINFLLQVCTNSEICRYIASTDPNLDNILEIWDRLFYDLDRDKLQRDKIEMILRGIQ